MKGVAYTLLTGEDEALFYDLRVFMERNGFSVPEDLKAHPSAFKKPGAPESVPRRNQIVYTNWLRLVKDIIVYQLRLQQNPFE